MSSHMHRAELKEIASVKLFELGKQRAKLVRHYNDTLEKAENAATRREKVSILYAGVTSASFAHTSLHPEVSKLDGLLHQMRIDPSIGPDLLDAWCAKLTTEIERGLKRCETTFLFAGTLEEWTAAQESEPTRDGAAYSQDEKAKAAFEENVRQLLDPVPAENYDTSVIDEVLKGHEVGLLTVTKEISKWVEKFAVKKVSSGELAAAVAAITRDNLVDSTNKTRLKDLLDNPRLLNEYAGVMTILINNFADWEWPTSTSTPSTATMRMRAVCNRAGKWRSFIDEAILDSILLQIIGVRWSVKFKHLLRSLRGSMVPKKNAERSSWNSVSRRRLDANDETFLCSLPETVEEWQSASPYGGGGFAGSQQTSSPTKKQRMLMQIATEVRLCRTVYPHHDTTVVTLDIRNFYPSLPHPLMAHMLETFGVTGEWLSFFKRFLSPVVTVPGREAPGPIQRGVLLGHALSKLMSELLLFLMDEHVKQVTGHELRLTRVVDDFAFVSGDPAIALKAHGAVVDFLRRCGLTCNEEKSGSLLVSGVSVESGEATYRPAPSPLPQGRIRWGLLQLRSDGEWTVAQEVLSVYRTSLEAKLKAANSVLSFVNVYNSFIKQLHKFLATPCPALGAVHLDEVAKCMASIHGSLPLGEGGKVISIVQYLRHTIESRFLKGKEAIELPEAWFYWPITAGGLGVLNPMVDLAARSLQREELMKGTQGVMCSFDPHPTDVLPKQKAGTNKKGDSGGDGGGGGDDDDDDDDGDDGDEGDDDDDDDGDDGSEKKEKEEEVTAEGWLLKWAIKDSSWGRTYTKLTSDSGLTLPSPERTTHLEGLIEDFKSRGSDVRGTKQSSLAPYFQWLICTYGEQIMSTFGSLGFTSAELIPLALISDIRREEV
eukprot:TRINITY_DN2654_c0_g1_i1.p1 TRINITY_DN2654_c0_g1~~TRINITY_DN2654_c0_g1_i1.p1  ORF type:complete len:884 (+),score=248.65 TRINITY_DN2654_c0_g1_i1:97-2748(+)